MDGIKKCLPDQLGLVRHRHGFYNRLYFGMHAPIDVILLIFGIGIAAYGFYDIKTGKVTYNHWNKKAINRDRTGRVYYGRREEKTITRDEPIKFWTVVILKIIFGVIIVSIYLKKLLE